MNKDLNKIKKSEEQRLNSLKLKADEYKTKKTIIHEQLANNVSNFFF